jgi:hypothetical protein
MMAEHLRLSPYAPLGELLADHERLYILSAARGSFLATVAGKAAESYRAILSFVAVVCTQGYEGIRRREEARTKTIEIQAKEKELDLLVKEQTLEQAQVETLSRKVDFALKTLKEAEERPEDDPVRKALITHISNFLGKTPDDNEVQIAYKRITHLNNELKNKPPQ